MVVNMITNSSIRSIHDTLKNAIGYNKDFKVEIDENSITNLDVCIQKLRNIIQNEGEKLPLYLDIKLPSIDKYDKLEWITKVTNIVELSNRLAKFPNISYIQRKMFYAIKVLGIDALSRINTIEEIALKGGGIDIERNRPEAKYTIQIDKYGKRSVISWHLGNIDVYSDFAHLMDPTNKNYQEYKGQDVEKYNSFGNADFKMAREMGSGLRYNENGMRALIEMLFSRRDNKTGIKEIISQNFPGLDISEERMDKLLNGKILEQEEKIYNEGGYSGIKIIESIIKSKIKENYRKNSRKVVEYKFDKLRSKFRCDDEEKDAQTVYLLSKIVETISFSDVNFDEALSIIETRVNLASRLPKTLGTVDEIGEKYEMMFLLENLGIEDIDKNIKILNVVENQIVGKNFSLDSMKTFMKKMKNVFSSFKFEDYNVEPETVIDSAIMTISKDIKSGTLDIKIFDDAEATSKILKSVKQQLSDKFKGIQDEKTESTISVDEIMEFVKEANCTKAEILEAVEGLLEFVFQKDNSQIKGNPLEETLELATSQMSSKGILDLRKKMMKGEFIGGGRY